MPIVVTAAREAEAVFRTDRGPRMIPAWQLKADGVDGSIWVADPEPNPIWEPQRPPRISPPFSGSPHRSIGAVLAADQRTLTVSFAGAPANRMSYSGGQIVQSDTALAIVPFATSIGRLARWQTAVGMQREVTVRLDKPLGRRVLVDLAQPRGGPLKRLAGVFATRKATRAATAPSSLDHTGCRARRE